MVPSLPSEPPAGGRADPAEVARPAFHCFDPVAQEYDQSRFLPPEIQEQAARRIQEVATLAPGRSLLDAGVGTGRFALPLALLGVPVVGVDISENMMARLLAKRAESERAVKRAQQAAPLPLRLARADLRRLPLADSAFGAVLMVHILHLIGEWRAVLEEVRRVLAPEGRLFLAWETGQRLPTRHHYFTLANERGVLRSSLGAHSDEVLAYLTAGGAQVARADEDRLQWKRHIPVSHTLEMLRRRTWSHMWGVPDAEHALMMADTEAWARQVYGTLDAVEEVECLLTLWVAHWPS